MAIADYGTRIFYDSELNKVESEFTQWVYENKKKLNFELEIISSNMFYAPAPGKSNTQGFYIYILYKEEHKVGVKFSS